MLEMRLYAGGVIERLVVPQVCEGFGVFFELSCVSGIYGGEGGWETYVAR